MAIQFEDAVKPDKIARVENPYTEVVASLAGTDNAKAFSVPTGDVPKARRQLTEAAHAANVTVRTLFADPDAKGNVKVTFWTVVRITRKAKDETPAPAAKPAAPAKKAATRRK